MAKSIKKNFLYNLTYQLLLLVSPLVVTPYLTRVLGPDNVGLYSYANSIVSYFLLVAVLGTATYGQRAVSYVQEDAEGRSRAFWEVFFLRLLTSFATLLFYLVYAFVFSGGARRVVCLILAINILNVAFDVSWFLQGMEEFGKTVLNSAVCRLIGILFIFLFVKTADDLPVYIASLSVSTILGSLTMWIYLPKYLVRVKGIRPFRDLKTVFQLFLPSIAVQIYTVLDKSMIGWFSPEGDFSENGFYEEAEKIVKIALTAVTALGIVMIPRISHTYKAGDTEKVRRYMYQSYRYVFMMGVPIMFGFLAISSVFSPVYFGPGYERCEILMPVLSAILLFIGLSNVTGMQYFVPTGRQNVLTVTVVIGAVVNFAANLLLIPFFHSLGASIGTVVAEFCVALAGFVYLHKTRQFPLKPIFLGSVKYFLAGGVMFAVLFVVKRFLPAAVWSLCLLIGTGIAVYFAALLLMRDSFLYEILGKASGMLRKKRAPSAGTEENGKKEDEKDKNDGANR